MIYIEDNLPDIRTNGLNTLEPVSFGSTLAVTGNTTVGGTLSVTGVTSGLRYPVVTTAAVGATVVLTAANSGTTYIMAASSGTPSFTLPTAAAGLEFTFITGNTTAGYTITGGVVHLKTSATGTALTSTTTVTNTQGTAVVGDSLNIVCDGTNWWMTSQTGIFAVS